MIFAFLGWRCDIKGLFSMAPGLDLPPRIQEQPAEGERWMGGTSTAACPGTGICCSDHSETIPSYLLSKLPSWSQVSSAVKAEEERWQDTLRTKCAELEQCNVRNRELQEEALTLSTRLERLCQEQAALVKAELAAARDVWIRDKQEEMSRLRAQIQREQKQKLQAVLEHTDKRRDTELHEALREKEQEWRDQQEIRFVWRV